MTKLSRKALDGLRFAVMDVDVYLDAGLTPEKALRKAGIKGWEDTYYFLTFLKEYGYKKLFKRLVKK